MLITLNSITDALYQDGPYAIVEQWYNVLHGPKERDVVCDSAKYVALGYVVEKAYFCQRDAQIYEAMNGGICVQVTVREDNQDVIRES